MSRDSRSNVRKFPLRDRNGIPILDPPHEANKLPKECGPGRHVWKKVGERYDAMASLFDNVYRVEYRCAYCPAKTVETEIRE